MTNKLREERCKILKELLIGKQVEGTIGDFLTKSEKQAIELQLDALERLDKEEKEDR